MGQIGTDVKAEHWAQAHGFTVNVKSFAVEGTSTTVYTANLANGEPTGLCFLPVFGLSPVAAKGNLWDLLVMLKFAGE